MNTDSALPQVITQTRPETPPGHDARVLTGGGTVAAVRLDDQVYSLRITRAGKLILTK